MERVLPVLFVLQNSSAFYSTCIVIFHVLFNGLLCTVFASFVALPYSKLLFIFPGYNAFRVFFLYI